MFDKKKIIIGIILIIFSVYINDVSAYTILDNSNDTSTHYYDNYSYVDNIYLLHPTDSLTKFKSQINIKTDNYPRRYIYNFYDSKNNNLKFIKDYNKVNGLITATIYVNTTVYYNNKQLCYGKCNNQFIYTSTYQDINLYNYFNNNDSYSTVFLFSINDVNTGESFAITSWNYNTQLFINKIILNDSGYTQINIEYKDSGITSNEGKIDSTYNSMNPVFRFLFLLFKGVLKVLNIISLGYVVSDTSYLEYQSYLLDFLIPLDYIISSILFIFKFIFVMGYLWVLFIGSLLIYIYSYFTADNFFDSFSKFFHNEFAFLNYVLIKPAVWVFDNLIIKVMRIIRG